jgi:transposase
LITLGVDAHKTIHVAVAVDEAGRELGEWSGPNAPDAWASLTQWAAAFGPDCWWGIEGAWGNGRGLAQHLVAFGFTVFEISPHWTTRLRRSNRRQGKSDRLDARAVARCVREEAPRLPLVHLEDDSVILDLLSTEREAAVAEATRIRNQIHALLSQIDPEYERRLPSLTSVAGLRALVSYTALDETPIQQYRAASVRRLAARLQLATAQAKDVAQQIRLLAKDRYEPLTRLCGVNLLTAGMLGPGRRFESEAQLAAYAGTSPLEASSSGLTRHRPNRGGNRKLNSVIYRIALTQAHFQPNARAYIERRVSEGKTRREAPMPETLPREGDLATMAGMLAAADLENCGSRLKAIAHRSV